ncbi:MAG: nitric oxide synthase oxygenase [Natronomonas sp.]|uniref:nitric oxide synthase oxygenase n=1 Tax=Natronomonas sp. TaxID=2184060 RepID=UPI002870441F|nr:nitric oxide synthase oxygenase [Natronomonas sp.]MDR9430805.1 nitric oxide synthase oxygenase [Natronomonas sp.]
MLDSFAQHERALSGPIPEYSEEELRERAHSFISQCYEELEREWVIDFRLAEIDREISQKGTYTHTEEELTHGARIAWRNSNRCIGRLFWQSLEVIDERDLNTPEELHQACCQHIEYARNGGTIRPTITIFQPDTPCTDRVRIWNYQLLRYAGYETDDGIVGDPAEVEFTRYCQSKEWEGNGGPFDPLPHVIQVGNDEPELFDVPPDLFEEVEITHPDYGWFADLGLRWYDVPIVSNMRLEIGGISYTAAPFNGWYMSTEIGARNFADEDRYDMLAAIGDQLGYDTSENRSLWKDEALVELNRAVIHSFDAAGVKTVDHHTASEQFGQFERNEERAGRDVTGDRSWLLPPMSSATTHVFDQTYETTVNTPNFFYMPEELTKE